MSKHTQALIAIVAAALTVSSEVAHATPGSLQGNPSGGAGTRSVIPVDGTWIVLDELMTEGSFFAPVFSYTSSDPVQIDVTDLFVVSDQIEVYLDGGLLGTTPLMPDWSSLFPAVGPLDDAPYTDDPDVAWTRPEFSKQSFALPTGTHLLTFRDIHIPLDEDSNPFSDGTVAFRLVPEPATAMLLMLAGSVVIRRRPGATQRARECAGMARIIAPAAVLLLAAVAPALATPCGSLQADVISGVLEIQGTAGADSIRVAISASDPDVVEIFEPATSGTPGCSFDTNVTPFDTIRVTADDDDDLVVFDDSNGILADSWVIEIDGGDGEDIVLAGIDLSVVTLSNALSMIDTLQEARDLIDRVVALLDASTTGCATVPCLVENTANVLESTGNDLVLPTANYVRDIESELVQPSAAAVLEAHDRIANYLQTFMAGDVQAITTNALSLSANVEVMVDEFDLLLPVGQDLLSRAETLYAHAASMGLNAQNGDAVTLLKQTVESHVNAIVEFADLCPEDPEPTETEFNEDLQDPSGLPALCAEVERRVEALELITSNAEASINSVEAEGDGFEADGDALEISADAIGDDENPSSTAAQIMAQGDQLVIDGDNLSATADAINADWEQWVGQVEADLEGRGALMDARGQTEVLGAANTLEALAQSAIETPADALRAEADQIIADLDALMIVASPLLRDDLARAAGGGGGSCPTTTTNTITGGPGNDALIGSTASDLIQGGAGNDLIVGAGGADRLLGDDGNDLIFGGGGADDIHGGDKIDFLVGNKGNDCIFGGGGQVLSQGPFSIAMGDIFVGVDGDDLIANGESEDDSLSEIDVVFGGAGDDTVRVSNGGNLTVGSFSFQFGNLVFGNDGNDDIATSNGVDVIFGGADDDTIVTGQGTQLTIGSNGFRLALGDLIFGGDGNDAIDSDDPAGDRSDDDIDVVFGGAGDDDIHGFNGGLLSIGDPSDPAFELDLGNLIFGGDDADTIITSNGIDVIFCGDGDDVTTTGMGSVLTIGSNGFQLALGDLIFGGDGNDTIDSDDPDGERADDDIDVVFGGAGDDTINAYDGGLLVIGDLSDPDFQLKLGNVVFGGDDNDAIVTSNGIDVIFAGDGDDTVAAGEGDILDIDTNFSIDLGDLIFGQDGSDTLHGDTPDPPSGDEDDGIDVIFGGSGDDNVYGGTGGKIELPNQNFCLQFGNLLFGGPDNDTLRGDYLNWDTNGREGGIDLIFGAGGDDTIEGSEGSLIIVGKITTGQAVIIAFGNLLFGGPGNDTIRGADEADICTGVSTDLDNLLNSLNVGSLGGAADLIFAGAGDDSVEAYDGIDFVFGSDGDDTLDAENGGILIVPISGVPTPIAFGNLMFGGHGEDVISSLGRLLLPTVPPMEIDLLFGGPCDDIISASNGFNLVFGNKADDTISAGDGINLLFGNGGEDSIAAGSGLNLAFGNRDDDVITAKDGVNVLFGNRGDDSITAGDGLNIAFGNKGNDSVQSGNGVGILFGNSGNDDVIGGDGLTLAFGNRGNDYVRGGDGLCVLFGNAGNDDVAGGNGLCVAFGNANHDLVAAGSGLAVLFGNSGEDRVTSSTGLSVLFGNRDNDILVAGGGGLFVAFGNRDSDVLVGGPNLNLMFGNRGNDQFFGSGTNIEFGNRDNDIMRGGGGVDFLFGNRGADTISGGGAKDFIFGNRDNDSLVTDGGKDFAFGNRGDDVVRSGGDGSEKDYLFGNRGNDALYGCSNSDKLFGGRGSDSKDRNDCNGLSLSPPSRGEVRGTVLIDVDGDGIGDVPHVGVTVSAGAYNAVTDADGNYRIAGIAIGGYTVSQAVPSGYNQISAPATYSVTVGSMGIDLFQDRDFVNREVPTCSVTPDGWGCREAPCTDQPSEIQCVPVAMRSVMRCPDTGEICDAEHECPCSECVDSWAVDACDCINPNTECYVSFDAAAEPQCFSQCVDNMVAYPCDLTVDGDLSYCDCPVAPPCATDIAAFTFSGEITSTFSSDPIPFPWDNVQVGDFWTVTYKFVRTGVDQNGSVSVGDYPVVVSYTLQIGAAGTGEPVAPPATLLQNLSNPGSGDVYNVTIPVSTGGPPNPELKLLFEDATGTSWDLAGLAPRDGLPLCGDIELDRFGIRIMRFGANLPGFSWQLRGSITSHECTNCDEGMLRAPADLDADGFVSQRDMAIFANCLAGPDANMTFPSSCSLSEFTDADLDGDADVDLIDFATFQKEFANP
ncbi:MAG: hypothetical protein H6817_02605 [Phycisphaerales bacterium]|nr:hypothetical protein [Phycisphaerales bacterium]